MTTVMYIKFSLYGKGTSVTINLSNRATLADLRACAMCAISSWVLLGYLVVRKVNACVCNSCNHLSQLSHNLSVEMLDDVALKFLYIFLVPQKLGHS